MQLYLVTQCYTADRESGTRFRTQPMCRIPWFCVTVVRKLKLFFGYWYSDWNLFGNQNFIHFLVESFWSEGKRRRESIKTALSLPRTLKKVGPKMVHFYCRKAYRDWLQIQDPQILTVGSPIESKDVWLLGQLFWRDDGSKRAVLILSLRLLPSDQKHSNREHI